MNSVISDRTFKPGSEASCCFGIKKQCVEFARRWLHNHKGMVYQDVKIAADIWNRVSYYTRVADGKRVPVSSIENGATGLPEPGDLIIYSEKFMGTGHVSVVVKVNKSTQKIELNEQNFDNQYQQPSQQRSISYVFHDACYWLLDAYLLGWKSLQESR